MRTFGGDRRTTAAMQGHKRAKPLSAMALSDWEYEFARVRRIKEIEVRRMALALDGPYYSHSARRRGEDPKLEPRAP